MRDKAKGINWDEVKRRLKESQLGLEKALTATEERRDAVYRRRALELADRQAQAEGPSAALRVLAFTLGAEHYGLELADLVEMLPFARCTPVPGAPPGELDCKVDAADALDRFHDFEHGEAAAIAAVESDGSATRAQISERI